MSAGEIWAPHPYQGHGLDFLLANKRAGLFLDMGLGKTSIVLSAIRDLYAAGKLDRVLVIAPKRVAEDVWTDEAAKWRHTTGLHIERVLGSEVDRVAALNRPAHIHVVNRENVKWLVLYFLARGGWPFSTVVVDESSSFKDSSSQRFKALRRVAPLAARLWLLTGTPAPNSYLDLWPQIYLLDKGERLGRSMTAFKAMFFVPDFMGYKFSLRPGAAEEINRRIADLVVSMRAADWLDLPPRVNRVTRVALQKRHHEAIKRLEIDFVLPFSPGSTITAVNAAVLAGKLLQLAQGAIYRDGDKKVEIFHDEKLDALAEIADVATGPLLVAYSFKFDLPRLKARFPKAVAIDEPGAIQRWQAGDFGPGEMLLAHPASAGHGLNLQAANAGVVWFGLTWSLELYQQFNARIHRQGQATTVVIHHLIADGTIDEDVVAVIEQKDGQQERLLNALRARVARFTRKAA